MELSIITPPCSDDTLSDALRRLTAALKHAGHERTQGCLGGDNGYGCRFESDLFMMHPYCWCEKDDCPWCAGCDCPDEPRRYWIGEREVSREERDAYWDAYSGLPIGADPPQPWGVWPKDVHSVCLEPCAYCRGEFGHAPNFHHKPSGLKVWWYKYIGRDMKAEGPAARGLELVEECIAAVQSAPKRYVAPALRIVEAAPGCTCVAISGPLGSCPSCDAALEAAVRESLSFMEFDFGPPEEGGSH